MIVISRYLGMFSLDEEFEKELVPFAGYFPLSWDVLIRLNGNLFGTELSRYFPLSWDVLIRFEGAKASMKIYEKLFPVILGCSH